MLTAPHRGRPRAATGGHDPGPGPGASGQGVGTGRRDRAPGPGVGPGSAVFGDDDAASYGGGVPSRLVRRVLLLPLLAVLAVAAALLAPPAHAHDALVGADPADGARLDSAPDAITLTFSNELLDSAQAVLVADATGATVAEGSPTVDGTTATLPLPALGGGEYAVTWSVVSSDGHRISGELSFSVAGDGTPATTGSAAAPSSPAGTASPDELTTPDAAATPSASSTTGAGDASEETGGSGVPTWLVILVAAGVAGAVVALAVRRWRDQG